MGSDRGARAWHMLRFCSQRACKQAYRALSSWPRTIISTASAFRTAADWCALHKIFLTPSAKEVESREQVWRHNGSSDRTAFRSSDLHDAVPPVQASDVGEVGCARLVCPGT